MITWHHMMTEPSSTPKKRGRPSGSGWRQQGLAERPISKKELHKLEKQEKQEKLQQEQDGAIEDAHKSKSTRVKPQVTLGIETPTNISVPSWIKIGQVEVVESWRPSVQLSPIQLVVDDEPVSLSANEGCEAASGSVMNIGNIVSALSWCTTAATQQNDIWPLLVVGTRLHDTHRVSSRCSGSAGIQIWDVAHPKLCATIAEDHGCVCDLKTLNASGDRTLIASVFGDASARVYCVPQNVNDYPHPVKMTASASAQLPAVSRVLDWNTLNASLVIGSDDGTYCFVLYAEVIRVCDAV